MTIKELKDRLNCMSHVPDDTPVVLAKEEMPSGGGQPLACADPGFVAFPGIDSYNMELRDIDDLEDETKKDINNNRAVVLWPHGPELETFGL
jgi:hypothetical protein